MCFCVGVYWGGTSVFAQRTSKEVVSEEQVGLNAAFRTTPGPSRTNAASPVRTSPMSWCAPTSARFGHQVLDACRGEMPSHADSRRCKRLPSCAARRSRRTSSAACGTPTRGTKSANLNRIPGQQPKRAPVENGEESKPRLSRHRLFWVSGSLCVCADARHPPCV